MTPRRVIELRVLAIKALRSPGCHAAPAVAWSRLREAQDLDDEKAMALWSRVLFRLAGPRVDWGRAVVP